MYYPLIDKSYLDTFGNSHWQVVLAMIGRNVTWRDASTTMGLIISFQSYIQIHSFALSWKQTCVGHCHHGSHIWMARHWQCPTHSTISYSNVCIQGMAATYWMASRPLENPYMFFCFFLIQWDLCAYGWLSGSIWRVLIPSWRHGCKTMNGTLASHIQIMCHIQANRLTVTRITTVNVDAKNPTIHRVWLAGWPLHAWLAKLFIP